MNQGGRCQTPYKGSFMEIFHKWKISINEPLFFWKASLNVPSFGTYTIIVYYLNWLSNLRHQTVCLAVENITYFQFIFFIHFTNHPKINPQLKSLLIAQNFFLIPRKHRYEGCWFIACFKICNASCMKQK